jgi:pyrimidine-nucleoside phosphorylase
MDGFAMTGQTKDVVPADKKLYALRDVTATVESIPLITASILSKKVAEGADSLVFDVKAGPGAFMKTVEEARALAKSLVQTGSAMGKRIVAVITDMSTPLGRTVGNFLEIEETLDCLEGKGPEDVMSLVIRLGAWMLNVSGVAKTMPEAEVACKQAVKSGRALELFLANVKRQGGDVDAMYSLRGIWRAKYSAQVKAPHDGVITTIDALKIGLAGVHLGVGRNKTDDPVSPNAGFVFDRIKGEAVQKGDCIATLYGATQQGLESALVLACEALTVAKDAPNSATSVQSLIFEELSAS